jgi:hypothetical protein
MSLPETVQSTLDGESVAARVGLGGEDLLLVTPTRTIVYRAEGLLSDETIDEFPHDAEHVGVSEGRRKATVTLDYGLDGERSFSIPTDRLDQVLHPVLAGVLNAAGITGPGETVKQTYRFSELTVVITSARLVRHIGSAVWDEEYDEYVFDDVIDLQFEEGSVATSVVISIDGRQERFKAPNDRARALREGLVSAVCAYHGVDDLDALRAATTSTADEPTDDGPSGADDDGTVSFGEGPDPLGSTDDGGNGATDGADHLSAAAGGAAGDHGADVEPGTRPADDGDGFGDSGFRSAGDTADPAVAQELAELRAAVEEQSERLDGLQRTVQQLIEELRQGR